MCLSWIQSLNKNITGRDILLLVYLTWAGWHWCQHQSQLTDCTGGEPARTCFNTEVEAYKGNTSNEKKKKKAKIKKKHRRHLLVYCKRLFSKWADNADSKLIQRKIRWRQNWHTGAPETPDIIRPELILGLVSPPLTFQMFIKCSRYY